MQGCVTSSEQNKSSLNPAPSVNAVQSSVGKKPENSRLNHCVFESRQLTKISSVKYGKINSQLYTAIKEAKYYSSISKDLSSDTAETLTPFYQFKILNICKKISDSMYAELMDGVVIAPEGNQ